eukprot:jgi/Ulvmu1/9911/UM057_0069.1
MQSRNALGSRSALRVAPARPVVRAVAVTVSAEEDRFRLNNLGPAPGSRKRKTRKGRGHAAGQGGPCGFGMRGQKSRSGRPTRPGFEGGQIPLYRRIPKLKGIAGGMSAGQPDHVTINLKTIAEKFEEGDEVTLEVLKDKSVLNVSGREAKLGLKVLGEGELPFPLNIKAECFSASAMSKIEAAGGSADVVPGRMKWTRAAHEAKNGKKSK